MKNKSILTVSHIKKAYTQAGAAPLTVIFDTSFKIYPGETVAVTGQSGSGKSTLMALLAGLDTPDTGTIVLNDRDINTMNEDHLARFRAEHIGIIFQQFHLMPHLTATENIMLPLEILKYKKKEIQDRTRQVLEQVNLTHRQNHLPSQLSGGECQRVAIARALVVKPALLLADEPTGNLDSDTGEQVADLLFDLVTASGMTLMVVTHNKTLAGRCQRSLELKKGQLQ